MVLLAGGPAADAPDADPIEAAARPPDECLDFDTPARDIDLATKEAQGWELAYVALHKAACRTCSFSADGALIATGSTDGAVRVRCGA